MLTSSIHRGLWALAAGALQRGAAAAAPANALALAGSLRVSSTTHQQYQQQQSERQISHSRASCSGGDGGVQGGPGQQHWQQQQASGAAEPSDDGLPPQQPELVERYLSSALMNRKQLLHQRKAEVVRRFQRFAGDTGSPEVQVAVLTERIRDMVEHLKAHRKDNHSMRGLQGMLNQRRALLSYLRRADFPAFCYVLHQLGLRDNNYARQVRYDKYRVGSRPGAPSEPIKRYGFR